MPFYKGDIRLFIYSSSSPGAALFYNMRFLLIFLFGFTSVFAQTNSSIWIIDSLDGIPVSSAIISDSLFSVVSDSVGRADISHINLNHTVTISHVAYQKKVFLSKNLNINDTVFLLPNNSELDEVVILGDNAENNAGFSKKVDLTLNVKSEFITLADVINRDLSIFVKDYGGGSGAKFLSYRGLSSENSLVLFNGVRVNDIRSGGFDLSSVSLGELKHIEFASTISSTGEISTGGVLSLDTRGKKADSFSLLQRFDNSGLSSTSVGGSLGIGKLFLSISGERMWSANRFNYEFEGKTAERENSYYNRSFISVAGAYFLKSFTIDLYTNYSFFNSGVPGFVVSNNSSSSLASNTTVGTLNILRFSGNIQKNSSIEAVLSYNRQEFNFDDPNISYYKNFGKDNSTLNNLGFSLKSFNKWGDLAVNFGYGFEKGESSDLKTVLSNYRKETFVKRNIHRISGKLDYIVKDISNIFEDIKLCAGINSEIFDQQGIGSRKENEVSYNAAVNLTPFALPIVEVKFNFFKTARIPSNNEYYYSSVFSTTSLSPEKSIGFETGITLDNSIEFLDRFSLIYYEIETQDKIIWVPSIIALQIPRNIAKVKSSGLEFDAGVSFFSKSIEIKFNYNYLNSVNISSYGTSDKSDGKQLVYSPKHRFNSSISYQNSLMRISLDHRFNGISFFTSDNDPYSVLKENNVIDLHLTLYIKSFSINHSLTISVFNLFNENYRIIQSYPMPLRAFIFSYSLNI
jgi:iron complex outermembrane receptor protein